MGVPRGEYTSNSWIASVPLPPVSTRSKIGHVAQRSGFGTGENLCKVFRRLVGMSPEQYRDRYASASTAVRHGIIGQGVG